ncbi:MAG: hypothetical protein IT567_04395 [Alphaproteobacteria bacterium]|nr:hypothetical protein [Alphaproteobacteria bacterium]
MITTHLTKLLCTRLCHDITGPIGAVNNGAELMAEGGDPDMARQAMELITGSAKEAVSRIQFFRQSYGMVKASGNADPEELKRLTDDFFATTHARCEWPQNLSDVVVSREQGQLLFNLLIVAHGVLIRGGTLTVKCRPASPEGVSMTVYGEGTTVRVEPWLEQALAGGIPEALLDSKSVQPYFAAQIARELGLAIAFRAEASRFELSAAPAK